MKHKQTHSVTTALQSVGAATSLGVPVFNNAKQSIPALFQEIIVNDNKREALAALPAIPMNEYGKLLHEKRDFRVAAEKALQRAVSGQA